MDDIERLVIQVRSKQYYVASMINLGMSYYLLIYTLESDRTLRWSEIVLFDVWRRSRPMGFKTTDTLTRILEMGLGEGGLQGRRAFRMRYARDSRIRQFEIFFRSVAVYTGRGPQPTDKYGVDPKTGMVIDPDGEWVGGLDEVKPK
jgi:hypothetical protein